MAWDERWMMLAGHIASWSKDRSRKTAAVIVDADNRILSIGWNGFPREVDDNVEARHERPAKYKWTEHAERNAIYNAAALGIMLRGTTMYLPWYPCADCARAIIQSGIAELVCIEPDWEDPVWAEDFAVVREMFDEAFLCVRFVDGEPPVKDGGR